MEKDRNKRYASAAEMKADLQHLKKETESGLTRTGGRDTAPVRVVTKTFQTPGKRQSYLLLAVTALLITVLAAVGTWFIKHRAATHGRASKNAIAVLPLQNLNGDFSVDYLRFALADEIANTLTYSRTLDVRPSAVTRKYVNADLDPQQVGTDLHVGTVLTGHFQKQGNHLLVTLEAIETGTERLLWQTNLTGSTQDLIGMQQQLAKQVRQGLLPMLGAAGGFLETSTRPNNQEAYDLYLRSVALSHDAAPNREAIKSLEHVVELDPNYAPAWAEVGQRYYYDATYSNGGEQMFQHSNVALERALALDPNLIAAASQLIVNRVDRGELGKAYRGCRRRWPSGVRRTPRPISLWVMCSVMPACSRSPRANATPPSPWLRATISSVPAPGRSWNWANSTGPAILSSWMRARSGPTTSLLPFCCAKAGRRRPVRRRSACRTLLTITAISWKPASGSARLRNWIAWRTMLKPASLQIPIPSFRTIRARFLPTAERRPLPSTCSRPRLS